MRRQLVLAWRQLTFQKGRFVVALCGVCFANVLMFMQFGFQDALFESATIVQTRLRCDVVVLNPNTTSLYMTQGFSRRLLYRLLSHPDIEAVYPLYVGGGPWKNPWTAKPRIIFILGIDLQEPTLDLPGLRDNLDHLRAMDTCLFDDLSRPEFGPVVEHLAAGDAVEVEVNRRRLRVTGTFRLGASFAADGNLLVSHPNFLRLFPERKAGAIDVGLLRIREGADADRVAEDVREMTGGELRVMTTPEFQRFEKTYWEDFTAIGFIFTQGVLMGFLVGFVIVTQILYMDVSSHLPQYATLKAMGFTDGYLVGIVFYEALLLSAIGYLPGILFSAGLYQVTARATNLPMMLYPLRSLEVFGLTLVMCTLAGLLAMRKLRRADPAEVF